ncbi:hypothetical protein FRB90_010090, partial [Tulasnella sp. 427]
MTSTSKLSTLFLVALSASSVVRAADNSADLQTLYERRIPFIVQTYPVTGGQLQLSG